MTHLALQLRELEKLWRQAGVPVDTMYGPGLDPDQTRSLLENAGLAAPEEALEWFGWHNGCVEPRVGITPLGPTSVTAYSLQEALRVRVERADLADVVSQDDGGLESPSYLWGETWLPIGDWGGQGVLTIDLLSRSDVCPVRDVNWSKSDFRDVREESLADLVDVWLQIIRGGGWTWSDTDCLWTGVYTDIPLDLRLRSLM